MFVPTPRTATETGVSVDTELDVETARWLVSAEGRGVVAQATSALDDGQDELGVATRLGVADARFTAAALTAAVARRRARERWPDADALLFTRASLEQASDPSVAAWRARRYRGLETWDLCAGVGGDTLALAPVASSVTAVECDPARAVLLEHNAAARGAAVDVVVDDALVVKLPAGRVLHADPARRRGTRRVKRLDEHVPAVPDLLDRHASVPGFGVVLSPALALNDPDLPQDVEVEFIQHGDRLVESIVWGGALRSDMTTATATLLPSVRRGAGGPQGPDHRGSPEQRSRTRGRGPRRPVGPIGAHLVEVAAAAVRARVHDEIAGEIGARRIASHRALFTTDDRPPPSPWYRLRQIVAVLPARPKAVRAWLRGAGHEAVEIVLHGVEGDPDRWWRELGRPPRGPEGIRIELVRLDRGARAVITATL